MILEKNYDEVEKVFDQLRESKEQSAEGIWKLAVLYSSFHSPTVLLGPDAQSDPATWKKYLALIDEWVAARPKSTAATIVRAKALTIAASALGGSARRISGDSEVWDHYLYLAKAELERGEKIATHDPEFHAAWLRLAAFWGLAPARFEKLYQRAIAFEPDYLEYYFMKVHWVQLSPAASTWPAVAEEVTRATEARFGWEVYARIVWEHFRTARTDPFRGGFVNWPLVRQGFMDLEKRAPGAQRNVNAFCAMASSAGDRETAADLFKRIGTDWDKEVWKSEDEFREKRAWALAPDEIALPDFVGTLPKRVHRLLEAKNWAALEGMAQRLRSEKSRAPSGEWLLFTFYDTLSKPEGTASQSRWEEHLERLDAWKKDTPKTPTARTSLGEAWSRYGWFARGSGYANTVKPEGFKLLGERLQVARERLDEVAIENRDPHWYYALLIVALRQGWPRDQFEAAFSEAVQRESEYYKLYAAKAFFLLPRWHGQPGEVQAFAEEAAEEQSKPELYARIVSESYASLDGASFEERGISWPKLRSGYEAILATYPARTHLLKYCWFACQARQRDEARDLFKKIGEPTPASPWRTQHEYRTWEWWANGGPEPAPARR